MVYLRSALVDDAEQLSNLALKSKAYWGYSRDFIQACKEDLRINEKYIQDNFVYVFEGRKGIVGFFAFQRGETDSLDFLYINPNFIGKGFGKKLWNYVIQTARELGIKSFTIDSDPNAKGFYEKMGAKKISETPSTVFEGRMLPFMRFTIED
ncbi:GNAT family N-acetyltransferase [Piscibacillus halophilus]|uniref:GNAT family N-acetyltransferase n=1 Tax=Piscibacillus halophilus TaxID=571933 RepID=UPI00158E9D1C|nr:GNAT family N-acetyltransferase [Piscibacillus halophilus]